MSQKLENQFNLALETPQVVRERTRDLDVGYDAGNRTWELIVKYNGSLEGVEGFKTSYGVGILIEPLIAGYAILTVPEDLVEAVAAAPEIEYVEKPKNFYFGLEGPSAHACIVGVASREPFLSGKGVLLAIIDSGLDYRRREFRYADGRTRIRYFWDQTITDGEGLPGPPEGFYEGAEFDETWINETLLGAAAGFDRMPTIDASGHGTMVAGIAGGLSAEGYRGVAPGAEFLIVKIGGNGGALAGYGKTTEIMRAVTYCVKKGRELGEPVVINLSYGNTYGAHDGSSLLERFLDNAAEIGRTVICVGSGNEGNASGHAAGSGKVSRTVELAVAGFERNLSVQVWTHYTDVFRITLRAPGGNAVSLVPERVDGGGGGYSLFLENTRILVYFGEPTPYSVSREIYLEMLPAGGRDYLPVGIWQFLIEPVQVVTGRYSLYLPPAVTRNQGTGFLEPSPMATLTIPSTASKVVTVGAYDTQFDSYADFSGRGYAAETENGGILYAGVKPDVVAPGVDVLAPDPFGGFVGATGTSFSTPIVSGSAALLMEWGIVRQNDPYLYGEKIKAYLRAGARQIRGEVRYPNDKVGYGSVCASGSLVPYL